MEKQMSKKKRLSMPNMITLMLLLIVVFAVLTWIIPSGAYERQLMDTAAGMREVAVPDTYQEISKVSDAGDLRASLFDIFKAPGMGIQAAADVVAFILIIGGAFQVLAKTNAMNRGIASAINKLQSKKIMLIPVLVLLFGLGGSTYGMSEETLPFFVLLLPVVFTMGYDSMTAFMIVFLGSMVGYGASTTNPFNVLIAQSIAGIKGNPQLPFRFLWWAILMTITVIYIMRHAAKVSKNPESSITYKDDIEKRKIFKHDQENQVFTKRDKIILLIFAGSIAIMIFGILKYGWYMDEIAGIFVAMGILIGIAGGLKEKEIASEFVAGVKDIAFAALIIGVGRGVLVVANNGMIIDTILNFLSTALSGVGSVGLTIIMYIVQSLLSIICPSSSGLAALTMPIMAPLCDLRGVNPEMSVTVLQFANQFTNIISPTGGVIVGLSICRISLGQWYKQIWKFFIVITVLGILFSSISGML